MLRNVLTAFAVRGSFVMTATVLAAATLVPAVSHAAPKTQEVTVKVSRVKLLDKVDQLSKGDLYLRVTIDGEVVKSAVVKGADVIKPDWKVSAKVKSGAHIVKVELVDKDVTQDDSIDINKVDKKRDLDFTVTKGCRIEGFSSPYKCGSSITRAGTEVKKAEITFSVSVK